MSRKILVPLYLLFTLIGGILGPHLFELNIFLAIFVGVLIGEVVGSFILFLLILIFD